MAFPTSSLTNNQVHKEGNRSFVYDSALGVWDQVRETDRTENSSTLLSGEIGSGVTFPPGHVIQTVNYQGVGTTFSHTNNTSWENVATFKPEITITAGNSIYINANLFMYCHGGGADVGSNTRMFDATNGNVLIAPNGDSVYVYINDSAASNTEIDDSVTYNVVYTPSAGTRIVFWVQSRANWGGTVAFVTAASSVVMMEIQT